MAGVVDMGTLGTGTAIPEVGKVILEVGRGSREVGTGIREESEEMLVVGRAMPVGEGRVKFGVDTQHLAEEDNPAAALQETQLDCSKSFFHFLGYK